MKNALLIAATLSLGLGFGCGKKDDSKQAPPAVEEPATPPAEAPPAETPPAGDESPSMINKMANCPNAVGGAQTAVSEEGGKIVVTITAEAAEAQAEIRKRAAHLTEVQGKAGDVKHSGEGTGSGALGKCPVVMAKTSVAAEEVEGGSKLTLEGKDGQDAAALKAEVEKRLAAMAAGGDGSGAGEGTGGGKGEGTGGGEGGDKAEGAK